MLLHFQITIKVFQKVFVFFFYVVSVEQYLRKIQSRERNYINKNSIVLLNFILFKICMENFV